MKGASDLLRPFLNFFVLLTAGIAVQLYFGFEAETVLKVLVCSLAVFVVSAVFFPKRAMCFFMVLMVPLGAFLLSRDYGGSGYARYSEEEIILKATVLDVEKREEGFERHLIRSGENGERILLNVYENTAIEVGNTVRIKGTVNLPQKRRNPKLFDYRNYLKGRYIHVVINAKARDIEVLNRNGLGLFESGSIRSRDWIEARLTELLDERSGTVMKSIMLGKSGYMTDYDLDGFRKLGIAHIIAVSGLHIGIIYGAVCFLMNRLMGFHKRISEAIGLVLVCLYAFVIGSPISAVRAVLMLLVMVSSKMLHRRYDPLNVVSLVGFAMLLVKPLWLLSLSFQLSFAGVFSVLLLSGKLRNCLDFGSKKLEESADVAVAAFFGMAPISIYYFNICSPVFILANMVIAPVLSASLVLSLAMVTASMVSNFLAEKLGVAVESLVNMSTGAIEFLKPDMPSYMRSLEVLEILLSYLLILSVFKIIDLKAYPKKVIKAVALYTLAVLLMLPLLGAWEQSVSIMFIDVGQGDSALISDGKKNYLIDSGGSEISRSDVGEMVLAPYLVKHGIRRLDGIVVSHFDADHARGFLAVMDKVKISNMYIGYADMENSLFCEVVSKALDKGIKIVEVQEPVALKLDKGNNLLLLPPEDEFIKSDNENDKSLMALLDANGVRALFTGDIEEAREDRLLEDDMISDVDILKVPHHGSRTSSSEEFVKKTAPDYAVIQVGKNNFGHPDDDVLKRYGRIGSEVYRNDMDGLVQVSIGRGGDIEVKGYLSETPNLRGFVSENGLFIAALSLYTAALMAIASRNKKHLSEEFYEL